MQSKDWNSELEAGRLLVALLTSFFAAVHMDRPRNITIPKPAFSLITFPNFSCSSWSHDQVQANEMLGETDLHTSALYSSVPCSYRPGAEDYHDIGSWRLKDGRTIQDKKRQSDGDTAEQSQALIR